MARVNFSHSLLRGLLVILGAIVMGGTLGLATAQNGGVGRLDAECSSLCTSNGNEPAFCESVCWIPDPAQSAKAENLDWQCYSRCAKATGRGEDCLVTCRRY